MVYFCMNFIISFITEAHETANEKVKQRSDWTEYFHYLGKSSIFFKISANIIISFEILGNRAFKTDKRKEIRKV